MKRLVVEPDFGAFPLWVEGGENDPDVPISEELRAALARWAADWEHFVAAPTPESAGATSPLIADWYARGQVLTERVQAELGPGFDVRYGPASDAH